MVNRSKTKKKMNAIQEEILKSAVTMVAKRDFDHLLYVGDMPLPTEIVKDKSTAKKKLIQAVTSTTQCQVLDASGVKNLKIPDYRIPRQERFKMALVAGVSRGILESGNVVVGIVGRESMTFPDTMMVITIGVRDDDEFDTGFGVIDGDRRVGRGARGDDRRHGGCGRTKWKEWAHQVVRVGSTDQCGDDTSSKRAAGGGPTKREEASRRKGAGNTGRVATVSSGKAIGLRQGGRRLSSVTGGPGSRCSP